MTLPSVGFERRERLVPDVVDAREVVELLRADLRDVRAESPERGQRAQALQATSQLAGVLRLERPDRDPRPAGQLDRLAVDPPRRLVVREAEPVGPVVRGRRTRSDDIGVERAELLVEQGELVSPGIARPGHGTALPPSLTAPRPGTVGRLRMVARTSLAGTEPA